jgi:hypothetical protein
MNLVEWIMIGLVAGGLGVSTLASKYGYGTKSISSKSSRAGHGGRYYRGGK